MPKERKKKRDLFQMWFDSDPEGYKDVRVEDEDLFCIVCQRFINSSTKTKVRRHLNSHGSSSAEDSVFSYELTEAFLASNIPLNKLEYPMFRNFLEKYTTRKIPHESTLRQRYVDQVYNNVIKSIREEIADNFVYFIIDEATDTCGRSVANFLIGALKSDSVSESHLVASKVLYKTSPETIVTFVIDCFCTIWPDQDGTDKVLVMLSDSPSYMLKAGVILSKKYTKMTHFTCITHSLNRIVEKIKDSFPSVNAFICNVKKFFIKAPTRKDVFKDALPDTPLPPELVETRWETWLEAVTYYDKHFDGIKDVICCFDTKDGNVTHNLQSLVNDQSLRDDIRYINGHYGFLVSAIKKLESHRLSLQEQFELLENVKKYIFSNNIRPVSVAIKEKMKKELEKNPGYNVLENIWKAVAGTYRELPPNILIYSSCLANFSYCPLSMVDVERLFSLHKLLLSDRRRRNFTPENLEKHIVICFKYRQYDTETLTTEL